jgi:type II secretory pathway pseudopilin PulG
MKKSLVGFTLVEVMVVVSIIIILSTVAFVGIQESQRQGRDAERKSDLRNLQSAIELYKLKYGRYPAGCRGPGEWSGQLSTIYACTDGTGQYIRGDQVGRSFAPQFIPVLPIDPRLNGVNSGYVYTTNLTGTVYKLMARLTVESEIVNYENPFKSCDIDDSGGGICDTVHPSNNTPNHCQENDITFTRTYAVWGGFANSSSPVFVERLTEDVVCEVP